MKVCIAEKPSVAKEIAMILGAKEKKNGFFYGNGYAVTWTFGHFCTLWEPHDYFPHWKKWDLNTLPMLPKKYQTKLIANAGVKNQFKVIEQLLAKSDGVINCGDAGQEGELIQRWVLQQANYKGPVERLWISSLTKEAIEEGFNKLHPASDYDNLFYAGLSRAIGDWILGMNATRLFTIKYGGYKKTLSVGRVQTPTLAIVVERQKEIQNFKPEPYWELRTKYRDTWFNGQEGRYSSHESGDKALKEIEGKPLTIKNVEVKEGKEGPQRLFDLTGLQVYCNTKFGFTAEQTLNMVQKLYESKVVTYPRVDTTYLPNDIFPKIPGILKGLKQYSAFTEPLLGKKIRKTSKVFNDKKVTDHHAIIPTGLEVGLPENQQKVYDAIVRRFIAAFYPDCVVSNSRVEAAIDENLFVATGKQILKEGWRELYSKSESNNKTQEEEIMPTFEKGEEGPHAPELLEKVTKPPKYFTEATLLRAMETAGKKVEDEALRDLMKENGIGRPSTRANIIETLFKRDYIKRVKKNIHATEHGIQLIDTIDNELLKSAELTGKWEKQLREIEQGTFTAVAFIQNMNQMVSDLVVEVRSGTSQKPKFPAKPETPVKSEILCPKCKKGKIIKGKAAYGCSAYKEGCDFRYPFVDVRKDANGKNVTPELLKELIAKK